jgi:hypothetical protein
LLQLQFLRAPCVKRLDGEKKSLAWQMQNKGQLPSGEPKTATIAGSVSPLFVSSRGRPTMVVSSIQGSWTMPTTIRPTLQSLRSLPTLHQVSESWGRLELKLETNDTRYWITTEGVPHKTSGTPINYVLDYVTVEKLSEDGNWDLKAVYSPDAWKLSQAFDYCQLLYQELHQINQGLETRFTWDLVRERERVQAELETVNKIIFHLSDKVRSRS